MSCIATKNHKHATGEDGLDRCVRCGMLAVGAPPAARFWQKVKNGAPPAKRPDLGPCWIYHGFRDKDGYGQFNAISKVRIEKAHRYAWILFYGVIPTDRELDHLCGVTSCVRPCHLDLVTHQVNILRAKSKPTCIHGHDLTGPDAFYYYKANSRLNERSRRCKACVKFRINRKA